MGRCLTPKALVTIAAFRSRRIGWGVIERISALADTKSVVGVMSDPIMPSVRLAGCAAAAQRVLATIRGAHGDRHTAREQSRSHYAKCTGPPAHSKRAGL